MASISVINEWAARARFSDHGKAQVRQKSLHASHRCLGLFEYLFEIVEILKSL